MQKLRTSDGPGAQAAPMTSLLEGPWGNSEECPQDTPECKRRKPCAFSEEKRSHPAGPWAVAVGCSEGGLRKKQNGKGNGVRALSLSAAAVTAAGHTRDVPKSKAALVGSDRERIAARWSGTGRCVCARPAWHTLSQTRFAPRGHPPNLGGTGPV